MDIKPRQCIAALNAHVRSGFPLVGDAETSVYAKDIIETIQRLVLKLNEANKAYEASEVDSGFEALTAYHHGRQDGFESAQPKWISVEERLPEESVTVLVYRDGCCGVARLLDVEPAIMWTYTGFGGDPTHWMPLPKAPKEET